MEIDRNMIEHMDHVALDIDPEKFVGGALLTKQEAEDLQFLASRLLVTVGHGIADPLMAMLKPKEYEPEPNLD